ncbi:MAG: circadian clock KaiB family protein [Pseudomonadota bacterium]|nr:circadian clock KaiB family protein [Pseudomonadota bacterium]
MTSSADAPTRLGLCLYIAGDWPNSQRALANLREILVGFDVDLEVVDCLAHPDRGIRDGVFYTPTLIKHSPSPRRCIVGNLSNRANVLAALMGVGDP